MWKLTERRHKQGVGAMLRISGALVVVLAGLSFSLGITFAHPADADAAIPEAFFVTRITANSLRDSEPHVSGDRVVWDRYDGSDSEICTWTPTGGTVALTSNSYEDGGQRVSGDRVVWYGFPDGDSEIFTWTPTTGVVRLTSNSYHDIRCDVSGDRVVWCGLTGPAASDVFTWTPSGGVVRLTTGGFCDCGPYVSGDRVVWSGVNGADAGVFTWTPAGGIVLVAASDIGDKNPRVSGDRLAWMSPPTDDSGLGMEIFTWTPGGGTVRLTDNALLDEYPVVSGDRVAWRGAGAGGAGSEVYTWTPTGGIKGLSTLDQMADFPVIAGDRVVWCGKDGTDWEIFAWSPQAGTVAVTANTRPDQEPDVSGDRVVWMEHDGSDWEIYTAVAVPVTVPAITELSPAAGLTSGGTTVTITGSGFLGLSGAGAVKFGGVNAASYTVLSPTSIKAVAPAHAAGVVNVTVTGLGGTSDTSGDADDFTYFARYQQNDSRLAYTGSWTAVSTAAASGGSFRFTNSAGASVSVPFKGTRIVWIAKKSPVYGVASVSLDGGAPVDVDLYSASVAYQKRVWDSGLLPNGLHTLKISWTGRRAASATDTNVSVDAFDVLGVLVAPTRFEQTDLRLDWIPATGVWKTSVTSYASGGSFRFANAPGAAVVVDFTGVRLVWIAKKSPVYGKARVILDGGPPVTVDLYSSTTVYRAKVWSTGFLAPGDHTVRIEWTGTKRAAATGTNINVDAVDIIGVLR